MSAPQAPDPGDRRAAAALMELTLSALEREAPDSWDTIAACLRGRSVVLALEGWDRFVLASARGRPIVEAVEVGPAAAVRVDRVALDALAGGRASMPDLVTDGHASMRGPSAELAQLSELPAALIEGIMRSPSAQELWDRFLQDAGVNSSGLT